MVAFFVDRVGIGGQPATFDNSVSFGGIINITSEQFFSREKSFDGIFGLAFSGLAGPPGNPITPYFTTLVTAASLPNMFTLQVCEVSQGTDGISEDRGGNLVVGAADATLQVGESYAVNTTNTAFFTVTLTAMAVGTTLIDVACTVLNSPQTIVDSGSTNTYLPGEVYDLVTDAILDAIPGLAANERKLVLAGNPFTASEELMAVMPNVVFKLQAADADKELTLEMFPWQYFRSVAHIKGFEGNRVLSLTRGPCGQYVILGTNLLSGYVNIPVNWGVFRPCL